MYTDGFIQSNGKHNTMRVGIAITASDKSHLEKFKKAVNFNGPIKVYEPEEKHSYPGSKAFCRIIISSEKMANDLIRLGCTTHKTDSLKYPSYEIVPKEFERDFIRGCLDGDGSIIFFNNKKYRRAFGLGFCGTEDMCKHILKFFGKENSKLYKRHPEKDTDNYQFNIGGNYQILRCLDMLYKDATVYLDRKYERYLKIVEESRTWK